MDSTSDIVKAVIDKDAIYCGACGHKLAVIDNLKVNLGNGTLYLKCHHKDRTIKCKTINEIKL